jgi:hypothetical protein
MPIAHCFDAGKLCHPIDNLLGGAFPPVGGGRLEAMLVAPAPHD